MSKRLYQLQGHDDPSGKFIWVERKYLTPDELALIHRLYDQQKIIADRLSHTKELEYLHANFVAQTGRVLSLNNMHVILIALRKKKFLPKKGRAKKAMTQAAAKTSSPPATPLLNGKSGKK